MQLALKLIASALQKQPKSQTLRVLKAVALQRSGKDEEGLQVLLLLTILPSDVTFGHSLKLWLALPL